MPGREVTRIPAPLEPERRRAEQVANRQVRMTRGGVGHHGITVRLRESQNGIAVRSFTRVVNEFTTALEEIDILVEPDRRRRPSWYVVNSGWKRGQGAVIQLAPRLPKPGRLEASDPAAPTRALWQGVKTLARVPEIPADFSERIVERLTHVREEIGRPSSGLAGVALLNPGPLRGTADISEAVGVNALRAVEPASWAYGSVVGILDVISARHHRKQIGLLVDHGSAIVCNVDGLQERDYFAAFEKRVIVEGILRRNGRGQPVRMEVDSITVVPETSRLAASALWGAIPELGEGQSAVDYIRNLRGE